MHGSDTTIDGAVVDKMSVAIVRAKVVACASEIVPDGFISVNADDIRLDIRVSKYNIFVF